MENAVEESYGTHEGQSLGRPVLSVLRGNLGRIFAVCFIIYLIALVRVGRWAILSLEHGFEWPFTGLQLFPVPIDWTDFGFGVLPVHVPMAIPDIILYVIFVGNHIWLVWGILAIAYIIHPPTIMRIKNRLLEMLNRSP